MNVFERLNILLKRFTRYFNLWFPVPSQDFLGVIKKIKTYTEFDFVEGFTVYREYTEDHRVKQNDY